MNKFKIAIVQLLSAKNHEDNLQKGLDACDKAKAQGADLVLFPEMWQLGYERDLVKPENAIGMGSDYIQKFCDKAKELNLAIAITYLGKGKNKPTNSVVIINTAGEIVLEYAKVRICNFDKPECDLEAGEEFKVCEINGIKFGTMICFDREFPESARELMHKGAEIILVPNSCSLVNCPVLGDVRFAQIRARAFENKVGVVVANYPAPKNDGHSCAIGVDGKVVFEADEGEGIFVVEFDMDRIRKWRKSEPWGL